MGNDVARLHHVGHLVRNMAQALTLYQRLGFRVPPPSYPTMAARKGAAPQPFGAANTHADFPRSFVELATYVQEDGVHHLPHDAHLVPLQAPPEVLPRLIEQIGRTSANLAVFLDRFEGLHILMFSSPDIDAAAARLTETGVGHGGVHTVTRPVQHRGEARTEVVRYLEISSNEIGAKPGCVTEGRVGVVADLDPDIQGTRQLDHPNGALDLIGTMLCIADDQLTAVQRRYEDYLDQPARTDGPAHVFDLDGATLTLVPASQLATVLPGEHPAALPAFVGYTVAVHDIALTRDLLRRNGFPLRHSASGDLFVPSTAALGAAIAFRQATPHTTEAGT
ncbi:VOC family protein [Streptomyces sp. 769]|uniref:VOC family protein n=1 Tax=Streptomyces sp. 769 TaxID=1262452 RepID=UPI00057E71DF|nr:VOC family protein [Streptomyces sp. 769]